MNINRHLLVGGVLSVFVLAATAHGQELRQAIQDCNRSKVEKQLRNYGLNEELKQSALFMLLDSRECKDEQRAIQIVNLLVAQGANVNAVNQKGNTPLMVLAAKGSNRAPVEMDGDGRQTGFFTSSTAGVPFAFGADMAQVLLNNGADAKQVNTNSWYDALLLAAHHNNEPVARAIARSSDDYNNALMKASTLSDYIAVENLLQWGADAQAHVRVTRFDDYIREGVFNEKSTWIPIIAVGRFGEMWAKNSIKTAQALIKYGADINDFSRAAGSALCSALLVPDADWSGAYVDFILSHRKFAPVALKDQGKNYNVWNCAGFVNTMNSIGGTWRQKVFTQLVKAGFDVNEKGQDNEVPLLMIVRLGSNEWTDGDVDLLLSYGARSNAEVYNEYNRICEIGQFAWCPRILKKLQVGGQANRQAGNARRNTGKTRSRN